MKYIKLFENFREDVNFDPTMIGQLKEKIGDLSRLTPYVLELGGTPPLSISESIGGRVHVVDSKGVIIKIFKSIDSFIEGIKMLPTKV